MRNFIENTIFIVLGIVIGAVIGAYLYRAALLNEIQYQIKATLSTTAFKDKILHSWLEFISSLCK